MLLFAGEFSKHNSSVSVNRPGRGPPWTRSPLDAVFPEHSHSEGVLEWACCVWAALLWAGTFLFPKDHPLVYLLLRSLHS